MQPEYIEDLRVEDIPTQSTDSLLESLSLEIMGDSIMQQINSDINSSRDFLSTVIDKFNVIIENADSDSVRGIKQEVMSWAEKLVLAIVHKYSLGYNNPDDESLEILDILESMYNFFILDRKEKTTEFFIQYIDINKKQLAETMGIGSRSGDVTTIANKKKNISKHNIPILSNIDETVKHILESGVTTEEFLSIIDDGDLHTSNVAYYFESGMLIGEIFNDYVGLEVKTITGEISMDLRCAIRMNLSIN